MWWWICGGLTNLMTIFPTKVWWVDKTYWALGEGWLYSSRWNGSFITFTSSSSSSSHYDHHLIIIIIIIYKAHHNFSVTKGLSVSKINSKTLEKSPCQGIQMWNQCNKSLWQAPNNFKVGFLLCKILLRVTQFLKIVLFPVKFEPNVSFSNI